MFWDKKKGKWSSLARQRKESRMVNVYVFITGEAEVAGKHLFTARALTEMGRWLAGAVSQTKETALERCKEMTERKIAQGGLLSGTPVVQIVEAEAPCIERALYQAFSRLP
jgi:hypothetical protein